MSPRLTDLLLSSQSDERLLALARAGHERAFAAIVERYRPELHALARRLCSDGRGEDVVQQALLSAFAALRAGTEVKHLRGWLYQIVRNAAASSARPVCAPLDGSVATAESLEEVVQQRVLAMSALSELARLPARQRQAMIGTALDGRPRAEIARSMGLSEGAVRQLVHRARTTLRGAVTALTPWPLARWLAALGPGGGGGAELAAGAGAVSSGGLAVKLGALLASGTLLTGAAVVDLHRAPAHPARVRAGVSGHALVPGSRARPVAVPSAGARTLAVSLALGHRPALAPASAVRPATPERRPASGRHGSRATIAPRSGVWAGGGRVGGRDGGGGARGDHGTPAQTGASGSSHQAPGSTGSGPDGGRAGGGQGDSGQGGDGRTGGGGSLQGARGGSGSDGGGDAQMASASRGMDSNLNDTSSGRDSSFAGSSLSGGGGASTGSGSSSGSGSGSVSGDGGGGSGSGGGGSWSGTGGSWSGDGSTSGSSSGSTTTAGAASDGGGSAAGSSSAASASTGG